MSGFWTEHAPDDYSSSLPGFLDGEEIDELIELAKPIEIEGVLEREGKFGEMFTVDFLIDGELRSKSFSKGAIASRDVFLADVRDHLDGGGAPVPCVLLRWGNGVGFGPPPPPIEDTPWPGEPPEDDGDEEVPA